MIARATRFLQEPLARLLTSTISVDDPWRKVACPVPLSRFGAGAQREFSWYFEGESRVPIASLLEVERWLRTCTYARDADLFHCVDRWQHPCRFEERRQGDCEDFALWAWRKLVRLGHAAELVAGYSLGSSGPSGHVWVLVHQPEGPYVFDGVVPLGEAMMQPLRAVRGAYVPEVSVDERLQRYAYVGYLTRRWAKKNN